jgi:Ca2+-binding EF-hand superfamily protein
MSRYSNLAILAVCFLMTAAMITMSGAKAAEPLVNTIDKDHDGTLDLAEVKAATAAHFDKLEKDQDGTLDANEVKGVIGPEMFKRADPDNDGRLDAKELNSKTARALRRLIR